MKITYHLFLLFGICLSVGPRRVCAQSAAPGILKLPAHTDIKKVSWWKSIYLYPEFQAGKITFSTGFSGGEINKLNYNLYYGQMDIINQSGDTLQMDASREIKIVTIGEHIFLHDDKGYIEILLKTPVALGVLTMLTLEKMVYVSGNFKGSMGVDNRGVPSIYDRFYKKTAFYFFIDRDNKLHKAVRHAIFQLFPGNKEKISDYINDNQIDFGNRADLSSLLLFCNQLTEASAQ